MSALMHQCCHRLLSLPCFAAYVLIVACNVQGRTTEHIEELLERSQEGSLTAGPRVQRDAGKFL